MPLNGENACQQYLNQCSLAVQASKTGSIVNFCRWHIRCNNQTIRLLEKTPVSPPVNSKFRHKTEVFIIFHQNDQKHGMNFIIFNAIFLVTRHGKYGIIYNINNEFLCTFRRCNYG